MNQLEDTQTVVLQQTDGKKIYLDVNVSSTDTTAIESFKQSSFVSEKAFEKSADISNASFDYATGIAIFLAMSATLLAYWFGARSFKLTEMSFKVVSEDIKQAAQTNRETTIELINNQRKIAELEITYKEKSEQLEKLIERGGKIIIFQNKLIIELYKLATRSNKIFEQNVEKIVSRLNELSTEILSEYHLFLLLMNTDSKEYSRIKILGDLFLQIAWDVVARIQLNHQIGNIYLNKEFKEDLNSSFKENQFFDEDEANHIKKIIEGEAYSLLSNVNDIFQNEIHQYLLSKKAA